MVAEKMGAVEVDANWRVTKILVVKQLALLEIISRSVRLLRFDDIGSAAFLDVGGNFVCELPTEGAVCVEAVEGKSRVLLGVLLSRLREKAGSADELAERPALRLKGGGGGISRCKNNDSHTLTGKTSRKGADIAARTTGRGEGGFWTEQKQVHGATERERP